MVKTEYGIKLESSDKVRDMLIASANYNEDAAFYSVQEITLQTIPKTSRKRRLDHLSTEEKIKRKKLKNREAAQTSRDRKKAYVTNLEESIRLLQKENKLLSERVDLLEEENKKLRCNMTVESSAASEPAAFSHPPQKGAALAQRSVPLKERLTLLLAMMMALTSSTGSLKILDSTKRPINTSRRTSQISSLLASSHQRTALRKTLKKWWGPGGKKVWRPPPPPPLA